MAGEVGTTAARAEILLAGEVKLPLMVHVGEPLPTLDAVLRQLDAGDIVTHCFHGKRYGMFEKGEPIPAVLDALDRGVRFNLGHGAASFNAAVAEMALARDILPYSISTDLHTHNINGPVWDLATTMSKLHNLGMELPAVISAVTSSSGGTSEPISSERKSARRTGASK